MVTRYYDNKAYILVTEIVVGDVIAGGIHRANYPVLDVFEHDNHIFVASKRNMAYNQKLTIYMKYSKDERITIFQRENSDPTARHPVDHIFKAIQQSIDEQKNEASIESDKSGE